MKNTIKTDLERLSINAMHSAMKLHLFRRSGRNWNRNCGDMIHVFNFQTSQHVAENTASFTLNIGIFIPKVLVVSWEKPLPPVAKFRDCAVGMRIGELIANFSKAKDLWWRVANENDVENFRVQLANFMDNQVQTFFDAHRSLDSIAEFLKQQLHKKYMLNHIYLAIVLDMLERREEAREWLDHVVRESPDGWAERAEIARRNLAL